MPTASSSAPQAQMEMPSTSCGQPALFVADELSPMGAACDESTEAESGAEETSSPYFSDGAHCIAAPKVASLGAAPCSPGALAAPTPAVCWQLIWCHERCHKHDCEQKKVVIGEAAEESGASLLCLKKAAKYGTWLEQAQRPPYGLLTDWREVKPCLQAAALHPPCNQPLFTVIFCELPKHFERASSWLQNLPPRRDLVHICRDLGALKATVADLASRLLSGGAPRSRPSLPGPPGKFHGVPGPVAAPTTTRATAYGPGAAALAGGPEVEMEKEYESLRKQRDSMWLQPVQATPYIVATQVHSRGGGLPLVRVASVEWGQLAQAHMVAPQIQVLHPASASPESPCTGPESAYAIQAMLISAMPDHYDD